MREDYVIRGPLLGQSDVCAPLLRALPQWFGIEQATLQYIQDVEALPTLVAWVGEQVVGFVSYKQHNAYAAEIHVMGVLPEMQRRGVGCALLRRAQEALRQRGVEYLQVKTLGPSHPDEGYARTRAFYRAQGFRPLEEFRELWGKDNPCLLMVKTIME
jgi:ribosomal protein S18 acetylase RimI-like enzyme